MRISDWSSDVCSSDLRTPPFGFARRPRRSTAGSQKGGTHVDRGFDPDACQMGVYPLAGDPSADVAQVMQEPPLGVELRGGVHGRHLGVGRDHVDAGDPVGLGVELAAGDQPVDEMHGTHLEIGRATSELQYLMRNSYAVFSLKKN